jgi:ubiquinone/menaquinone biosynthesis C-methylase UbiE
MKQRIDEWTMNYNDDYFNRQFKNPYQSTIQFCDWMEELGVLTKQSNCSIMDIGTGKGANLYYMKQRFPDCKYLGLDINKDFVQQGNLFFNTEKVNNCALEYGDLYNLDLIKHANKFEGIISYQTLSWLPEYESALNEIIKLNPNWISLTSLFYDGLVDCKIEIQEFLNPHERNSSKIAFYNIYSLPRIENFLFEKGYKIFKYCPFEINIDLPKPKHTHMQTYTKTLIDGKRLQISGPLLMNWYFIYAEKG